MATFYEFRTLTASLVFDLTDAFAQRRGTRGPFPRPFEPIRFLATAKTGINPQVFEPPLELMVYRNGGGYHVFRNMAKKSDGTILRGALVEGTYEIRVESNFYQRADLLNVSVPQPKTAASLTLLPSYRYPFPMDLKPTGGRGFALLRGGVHTSAGKPIENARVESVGASDVYITDKAGQWVLIFPDSFFPANQVSANVTVVVTPPGGPAVNVPNVTVDKGAERTLSETALRGWVLAGGLGVGDAIITVQGQPGNTSTAVDGSWFYYFAPDHSSNAPVDVTAELPNGSTQTQNNQQVQPRATAIVPPFQFP